MAKKNQTTYLCSECGWSTPKWMGQCRECGQWGTMSEFTVSASTTTIAPIASVLETDAKPISLISAEVARARPTGVGELDRVLGGGIVPGAVVLLAGEPGVGKSTLLLDVAAKAAADSRARADGPVLYISGEESTSQIKLRAERIGAIDEALLLAAQSQWEAVAALVQAYKPSLLIVDSIQTLVAAEVEGSAGGVTQVRAVTARLITLAKERNLPVILVGHVTKDGNIAGPRVLEHLVDVVCQFEGERHARLRLLRAVKNRYGATDEVGCFDLTDTGIEGLPDPSGLFLSGSNEPTAGTCVTVTLEGRRPMPTEIQALVARTNAGSPRRTTSGVDHSRVAMMLAVMQARLGFDVASSDVYVSTVGGARTCEPAADLALTLALVSAHSNTPLRAGLIACGEVGLTGELRATTGVQRRLTEAARLGFTDAIIPASGSEQVRAVAGLRIFPVSNLASAVHIARLTPELADKDS